MLGRIASWIFLLTGVVIGLGAFGHDSNAAKLSVEFAKHPVLDASTVRVILAVWHFCSGCMFVLGAICVWTWWRARRGERAVFLLTDLIGAFYAFAGLVTVWYTGLAFFWLFFALGTALIVSSLPLRSGNTPTGR